ncbi:MAG: DUF3343 domain-containing protein [Lachnospiraceae bacterium]|nr:DUF3343 domain-containing protein [Lachnospiraceae bacterium]
MRKKELSFLVTFHTTTGAMAMEKYCHEHGVMGRLIPVPREITAGCGMAWKAPIEKKEEIQLLIQKEKMDADGEYEIEC